MEAFESFVKSEAFFPVIMILLIVLLVLLFVFLIMNKKSKKQNAVQVQQVAQEIPTNEVIQEEIKEEVKAEDLPLVNIPIPNTEDTEFVIEPIPEVNEAMEEQVVIPEMQQLIEGEVSADEIVNIETPIAINSSQDVGEEIELPIFKTTVVEEPEEQAVVITSETLDESNVPESEKIEIETTAMEEQQITLQTSADETKPISSTSEVSTANVINSIEENHQAFGISPTADTTINENVVIEQPKEYTGVKTEVFDFPDFSNMNQENVPKEYTEEKTEVFDFPDFSDLTGKTDNSEIDVDEEIIKTANEYIQRVMAK